MKKFTILSTLIIILVSIGVGIMSATSKELLTEKIERQIYNGHLIWDEIDKNYYCIGSAINCTKPVI